MKACPHCRAEYVEEDLRFCIKDGSPLVDLSRESPEDDEIETVVPLKNIPSSHQDNETLEWNEDEISGTSAYPDDDFTAASGSEDPDPDRFEDADYRDKQVIAPAPESEKKRSYFGLLLAGFALAAFFLLTAALAGAYLYYRSSQGNEVASANSNNETNLTEDEIPEDEPANTENENAENENLDISSETNAADDEEKANDEKKSDYEKEKDKKQEKPSDESEEGSAGDIKQTKDTKLPNKNDQMPATPKPPIPPTPRRTPFNTPKPSIPKRISGGVVNGKALSLPLPPYPSAARAVGASGTVRVLVVIGRDGKVISANAVSGHPLLRSAAASAARRARFRPTLLSGQPVEVSGYIIYNFRP